jgi:hypothetical protein
VITAHNTPEIRIGFLRDNFVLKKDKVRQYRDEIAAVAASLLGFGCANLNRTVLLSDKDRAAVTGVTLSRQILTPAHLTFPSPRSGGGTSLIVSDINNRRRHEAMEGALLGRMNPRRFVARELRQAFLKELEKSGQFEFVEDRKAEGIDAGFVIEVKAIGFECTFWHYITQRMTPYLRVSAILVGNPPFTLTRKGYFNDLSPADSETNPVLWRTNLTLFGTSPGVNAPTHHIRDYVFNAENTREGFKKIIDEMARVMVSSLLLRPKK